MTLPLKTFTKTDNEKLDYHIDYSRELTPLNDTITQSLWTVPEALVTSNQTHTETRTSLFLESGLSQQTYKIINKITTAEGRIYEKFFELFIDNP